MKRSILRELVGPKKFDEQLKQYEITRPVRKSTTSPNAGMGVESNNDGLKISEGRKALTRASKRSYKLPKVKSL